MTVQSTIQGVVARAMSAIGWQPDGIQSQGDGLRIGRYGELYALSLVPDMGMLADEGSLFTVNNAQTGVITSATVTAFSATNPFMIIYNKDVQPNGKRIALDYAAFVVTVLGGAGQTSVQCAVSIDTGNRYTSGGTEITGNIVNPNFDAGNTSIARVWAGNITATAATSNVRNVVGNRYLKGAVEVVADTYMLKFGGVDAPLLAGAAGTAYTMVQNVPKVIVGPGESALIYLWFPTITTTGVTMLPEATWVER